MTTQVRPWPAGGAWNTVSLASTKNAKKDTTWGATLSSAYVAVALRAVNLWVNVGGAGTGSVTAQKVAHAVGIQFQEV